MIGTTFRTLCLQSRKREAGPRSSTPFLRYSDASVSRHAFIRADMRASIHAYWLHRITPLAETSLIFVGTHYGQHPANLCARTIQANWDRSPPLSKPPPPHRRLAICEAWVYGRQRGFSGCIRVRSRQGRRLARFRGRKLASAGSSWRLTSPNTSAHNTDCESCRATSLERR